MGDWYYIGHYGQLGPLTREQIDDLIEGEVIAYETYVWRVGMPDWTQAGKISELIPKFGHNVPEFSPPPPPAPPTPALPTQDPTSTPVYASYHHPVIPVRSDKSRLLSGTLQIIPGVGRMYLGYGALGLLQLVSVMCGGIGFVWSWVDGILILAGNVKYDGYGRRLGD